MPKLRLDPELLRVQSFNTAGVQPADLLEMSHGTCPKDGCHEAMPPSEFCATMRGRDCE